jgi:filamentous hemagglutinin
VAGHELISDDGQTMSIGAVLPRPGAATMLNLTVNDLHTYYVMAGNTPILVHNSNCDDWVNASGILRDATRGKGNFGLGSASRAQADGLGSDWVGEGYSVARDGKTLVSADGLRQYRSPSYKPNNAAIGRAPYQANFQSRWEPRGAWQRNGHLDILDME